jgi:hypothetical protein
MEILNVLSVYLNSVKLVISGSYNLLFLPNHFIIYSESFYAFGFISPLKSMLLHHEFWKYRHIHIYSSYFSDLLIIILKCSWSDVQYLFPILLYAIQHKNASL